MKGNLKDKLNKISYEESFRSLSHIFSTPIIMLKDALDAFRYIGPLRTIPEEVLFLRDIQNRKGGAMVLVLGMLYYEMFIKVQTQIKIILKESMIGWKS